MEKVKYWWEDIWGLFVSFACWFTPEHCERISSILGIFSSLVGLLIGIPTLIFITIPKIKQRRRNNKKELNDGRRN